MDRVGTYEVENGKIYITLDGETKMFGIDEDGCIKLNVQDRLCKKP